MVPNLPQHLITLDGELCVLGYVLLHEAQQEFYFEQLKSKYFVSTKGKQIFEAINKTKERSLPYDILSIIKASEIEKALLLECISFVGISPSFQDALNILISSYMARETYKLGTNIVEHTNTIYDGVELAPMLHHILDEYEEKIEYKPNISAISELLPKWMNSFNLDKENNSEPYYFNIEGLQDYFLKAGHLVSIVGRVKSGKSTMLGQIIVDALEKEKPVFLATLEVSEIDFLEKIIACKADVNPLAVQNFGSNRNQFQIDEISKTISWLENKKFQTYHASTCYISELIMRIREFAKVNPNPIILVDQLQFINSGKKFENKIGEYDYIMQKLKSVAFETKSMIFLAHQLNRDVERAGRKYPQTSDIKDCGRIEEISDLVIMFAKSNEKDDEKRYATIISRHMSGGNLDLNWDKKKAKFIQILK